MTEMIRVQRASTKARNHCQDVDHCQDEDNCRNHLGIDHCQDGNCCQDRDFSQNGNEHADDQVH